MNEFKDEVRQKFEASGKLYPCVNPVHKFSIGSLVGEWQWSAGECWSVLTDRGVLRNHWFCFGSIETVDGLKAYSFQVWRLALHFGFINDN